MAREDWRPVLEAEIQRWRVLSWQEILSRLAEVQAYQVVFDSKEYNVEVELLENQDDYIHFFVAVDDGSLPASI